MWRSKARNDEAATTASARLGKRVRLLRQEAGLTQEDAAYDAGLDSKHLQDIEYGGTNPTLATLVGLARALDVSLSTLLDGV